MKTSEIVVGGVYEGKNGQHRRVIATGLQYNGLSYNGLSYKVVKRGKWRGFIVGHKEGQS